MIEREGGEALQVCSHAELGLKDFATLKRVRKNCVYRLYMVHRVEGRF
jgi:hypothetical protein